MSMQKPEEKRSHERYDYPSTIEYVLSPTGGTDSGKVFKGVVFNISNAGIGLYVFSQHAEGEELCIKSSLPVDRKLATVRWVQQEHTGFFKAGLMFGRGTC